jgi:putative oxidoreductase
MMGTNLKEIVTSKYLAFAFRLSVGGFFLYACMSKIPYPAQFAEATANYQIVPYWMLNIGAVLLPWAEFVCGLFLIIGFMSRASAVLLGLLLIMFNTMVLINMYWGAPISCGCYDTVGEPIGWKKIIENLFFLGFLVHVFFFDKLFIFRRGGKTDVAKLSAPSLNPSR